MKTKTAKKKDKVVDIYIEGEDDGWRMEVYHGEFPQCVDDGVISWDTNASDNELIKIAKKKVKGMGLNPKDYKYKVMES